VVSNWQQCHQITATIYDTIDWDALATAYKEVPIEMPLGFKMDFRTFQPWENMAQ